MNVALGISASSREISVALRTSDGTLHLAARPDSRAANDLTAVTAALCREHEITPSDISELRIDVGPGSYTGLRVAITFARVTSAFRDVPILTTTSLALMALAAWNEGAVPADAPIRPVLDARRQRFHHARVCLRDKTHVEEPPRATALAEFGAATRQGEVVLAAAELRESLASVATAPRFVEPVAWDAALLFDPRIELHSTSTKEIEPLYLMGSYAE